MGHVGFEFNISHLVTYSQSDLIVFMRSKYLSCGYVSDDLDP